MQEVQALNLKPYLLSRFYDGAISGIIQHSAETFCFSSLEAIANEELVKLLFEIRDKFLSLLKKHRYLGHEGEMVGRLLVSVFFEGMTFPIIAAFSFLIGRIAFGLNNGQKVSRIRSGIDY